MWPPSLPRQLTARRRESVLVPSSVKQLQPSTQEIQRQTSREGVVVMASGVESLVRGYSTRAKFRPASYEPWKRRACTGTSYCTQLLVGVLLAGHSCSRLSCSTPLDVGTSLPSGRPQCLALLGRLVCPESVATDVRLIVDLGAWVAFRGRSASLFGRRLL